MKLPVNIHTHRLPQVPGEAIVNCFPESFAPQEGGWYSVGVHPWHITSPVADEAFSLFSHPQVLAIGEAGLDKLADAPMPVQMAVFERQARLSMKIGKPLVIHLVKAADELLKLKRMLRPSNPWIIHGFRGKSVLAKEYLRHGFYLSFGEKYQDEALRLVPADRLFIETDESVVPVDELYGRAAGVRGVSLDEFRKTVQENISKTFFER